jgi:penicillin-insensitive murein endopeptidase
MRLRITPLAALLIGSLAADAGAQDAGTPPAPASPRNQGLVAARWQAQRTPATGPALSIGTCSCGCLQGAATLPVSGRGFETLRLFRNRRYGHPALVAFVQRLGAAAAAAKVGPVIVGDLSQPRGGPTPSGHRSHQTGLDADIGYTLPHGTRTPLSKSVRESLSPPAVVDAKTHQKTASWTPRLEKLLALAAADPAVDRIFIDPGIKKIMCEGATAHAAWQGKLRPWWNHHDHFHVRLACPADSPQCVPQEPPPNDGCGAPLAWWFSEDATATRTKKKQAAAAEPEPELPPACAGLVTTEK